MTPSNHGGSAAHLSDADLEVMLARTAEEGTRRALSDVGLGGRHLCFASSGRRRGLAVEADLLRERMALRRIVGRHHRVVWL